MRPAGFTIRRTLSLGLAGLALLGTAGCIRFGAKPPEKLLTIASEARITDGKALTSASTDALYIELPGVPRSLATQRIAVRTSDNSYAYVQKALWVDMPARQFQSLLSETISARTGRLVLDPAHYPAQVGHVLHGELIAFGADASANQAVVTYDVSMLAADGTTMTRQRFSAHRPLGKIDADSVAPAISAAANEVAAAVADWVKALK